MASSTNIPGGPHPISASRLDVEGVCVVIGRKEILRQVGFKAEAGRFSAIIGPNGSGKSTLLKAIIGELGYHGSIRLAGRLVSEENRRELSLCRAVLPQHTSVAFPLTVHEVVSLGRRVRGNEGGSYSVEDALAAVDLNGFSGRSYQQLSGGEQQRVQLARVLCQVGAPVGPEGPRWLFLDEPVSSLDIKHQLWVMRFARSFAEGGGGVVAVMHDLNLTAMFADHVLALKQGEARAEGSVQQVITSDLVSSLYECVLPVGETPGREMPFVLPQVAGH
ncbi:heme ABC transporter ATP-binding protein [Roseibium sp. CAU 1637]|uniref:Heme ABC transporter ATP-binding protein n=1 Tax=Roseibium limicola TaxID=2816037 RepID=A0A939J4C2_9HYPH|nr:heme ABC transporter ATP-binding protein [Roseibium limicola]MBO0344600.1 heme ABC transporter ATP-binding protein [Roseibium limicola]